jgi:hypothetical protein
MQLLFQFCLMVIIRDFRFLDYEIQVQNDRAYMNMINTIRHKMKINI